MRGMGRQLRGFRGMGDCQPGYSSVLGVCIPDLSTDVALAQQALTGALATGVATTPGIQAAAANAAQNSLVNKIVTTVKAHPYMTAGIVVGSLALIAYGGMSFTRRA